MRAYFEKLLDSSQQQKQLPLIFPLLIALFSGAVFSFHWHLIISGGWQFYLRPYSMQHYINAQRNKHLPLVGATALVYGL